MSGTPKLASASGPRLHQRSPVDAGAEAGAMRSTPQWPLATVSAAAGPSRQLGHCKCGRQLPNKAEVKIVKRLTEEVKRLTEKNKQLTEKNKQLTEKNKQLTQKIKDLGDHPHGGGNKKTRKKRKRRRSRKRYKKRTLQRKCHKSHRNRR